MESERPEGRLTKLAGRPPVGRPTPETVMVAAPSKATLEEVRVFFERYAAEVEGCDLSRHSKTMYVDFANCFVRWMHGGFKPGLLGTIGRSRKRRI